MEYFSTYKNKLFILLTRIMNQAIDGKEFTEEEVEKLLRDTKIADEDFIQNILGYGKDPYGIMDFDFKPTFTDKKIPVNPTNLEKRWLKSIIQDDFVRLFLNEDVILKLENKLKDVEPLFIMNLKKENINEDFIKRIIISFRYDKFIKYKFINKDVEYEKTGIPFKLNYSIKENNFKLSVYCIEDEELSYIGLDNIKDIEIVDDLDDALNKLQKEVNEVGKNVFFKEKLKNQTETLKLKIIEQPDKNTIERVHLLFSSYDKKSFKMKDYYILEVKYYKFDEENVIKNILSLGVYATVLEPESVKQKVISLILKGYNLQEKISVKFN